MEQFHESLLGQPRKGFEPATNPLIHKTLSFYCLRYLTIIALKVLKWSLLTSIEVTLFNLN